MTADRDLSEEVEPFLSEIERSLQLLIRNRSDETLSVVAELQQVLDHLRYELRVPKR